MANPATAYGPVAEREFDAAPDYAKPNLTKWLDALSGLSDDDFRAQTASAIHGSALTNSWRGNWAHEDCKASAAHNESRRRHLAAGHSENCTGDTLYSQAFAQVWRSQGHPADSYPPRRCDCGATYPGRPEDRIGVCLLAVSALMWLAWLVITTVRIALGGGVTWSAVVGGLAGVTLFLAYCLDRRRRSG